MQFTVHRLSENTKTAITLNVKKKKIRAGTVDRAGRRGVRAGCKTVRAGRKTVRAMRSTLRNMPSWSTVNQTGHSDRIRTRISVKSAETGGN